jgi:2'-5' RNA ligase
MRLFFAIELPREVREHLARLQEALRPLAPKASFTPPENLHITLRFLGNVRDDEVPRIDESMQRVTASPALALDTQQVECFPNRGGARILAAGMGGDLAALKALHQAIEQRCRFLGFQGETRAYRPHATLARARPVFPPDLRASAPAAAAPLLPGPVFEVNQFVLVQSRLSSAGAQYAVMARYPFERA